MQFDDFIYNDWEHVKIKRKKIYYFCLNCSKDRYPGIKLYRVSGAEGLAVMLQDKEIDCKRCGFPAFSSSSFRLVK